MTTLQNEKLETVIKAVHTTGLQVYAAIGKYKKACNIAHLEDDVLISACEDYLKYRARVKGKHWPYFIRILHSKQMTWKPKDVYESTRQVMSIQDILAKIMASKA